MRKINRIENVLRITIICIKYIRCIKKIKVQDYMYVKIKLIYKIIYEINQFSKEKKNKRFLQNEIDCSIEHGMSLLIKRYQSRIRAKQSHHANSLDVSVGCLEYKGQTRQWWK